MVDQVGDEIALSAQQYVSVYGCATSSEQGNFYEISSTRYLLKAEIYASLPKDIVTTCSVYESDVKAGTYYLISPGSGGKSVGTTSLATAGWQPCTFSPPVKLLENRFYLITVGAAGGFSLYFAQKAGTDPTTFGSAYASGQSCRTVTASGNGGSVLVDQRLTTVP